MNDARSEITGVSKVLDEYGKKHKAYAIVITVPSPFHSWQVLRRYTDFVKLYKCMTRQAYPRRVPVEFPLPDLYMHTRSLFFMTQIAMERLPALDAYLAALLRTDDLTIYEIDVLKQFINFDEHEDFLNRQTQCRSPSFDSDFGSLPPNSYLDSVRQQLFREQSSASPTPRSSEEYQHSSVWKSVDTNDDSSIARLECIRVSNVDDGDAASLNYRPTIDTSLTPHDSRKHWRSASSCISPNYRTYGISAEGLKEAIRSNDIEGAKRILANDIHLATALDNAGNTILYAAALYGSIQLGLLLIHAGADPFALGTSGVCAMDVALSPWREIILRAWEKHRMRSASATPIIIETDVALSPVSHSLGLHLGKAPDNRGIVVGFKRMSDEQNPASLSNPSILICDVILAVNGIDCPTLEDAVSAVKSSEGSVHLKLQRLPELS